MAMESQAEQLGLMAQAVLDRLAKAEHTVTGLQEELRKKEMLRRRLLDDAIDAEEQSQEQQPQNYAIGEKWQDHEQKEKQVKIANQVMQHMQTMQHQCLREPRNLLRPRSAERLAAPSRARGSRTVPSSSSYSPGKGLQNHEEHECLGYFAASTGTLLSSKACKGIGSNKN